MSSEPLIQPSDLASECRQCGGEAVRIFEELPKATIVSVSRPETGEISPILLSYTIELQYKQACTHFSQVYSLVLCSFLSRSNFSYSSEPTAMVLFCQLVLMLFFKTEFQGRGGFCFSFSLLCHLIPVQLLLCLHMEVIVNIWIFCF